MHSKKNATGVYRNVILNFNVPEFDSEDCQLALQAAVSMSRRFREDIAIMDDLRVVKLCDAIGSPLEIIRHQPEARGYRND